QYVVTAFLTGATQRVAGAEGRVGVIDEAVRQVLVTAEGDAQAGGLDDEFRPVAVVLDDQPARLHLLGIRSEEHTSELQSRENLVCRLLLEKKKRNWKRE